MTYLGQQTAVNGYIKTHRGCGGAVYFEENIVTPREYPEWHMVCSKCGKQRLYGQEVLCQKKDISGEMVEEKL